MTKRKGRVPQEVAITNEISNNISIVFLAMRLYRHQIETSFSDVSPEKRL